MPDEVTLDELLSKAREAEDIEFGLPKAHRDDLSVILDNAYSQTQKAALAVMMTLLLKKNKKPKQDMRLHQARMEGGFSARGLDQREVTPFLRRQNFPSMSSTGWLTRSFEQNHPYDQQYPGEISPPPLKIAFLNAVEAIQVNGVCPESSIMFMLRNLCDWRSENASLILSNPSNKTISEIVDLVKGHWEAELRGVAKLPVLAIHAAYLCLVDEVERYKYCKLDDLRSHTSADNRTNRTGDVDVFDSEDNPFESVEIKHGQRITVQMIEGLKEKISSSGVKCFYILSTDEEIKDMDQITDLVLSIRQTYGCQVIVNGVAATLKYYLRLMKDTNKFVSAYVALVCDDREISFELKERWNQLIDPTVSE